MSNFSNEELDAAQEALANLMKEQEEKNQLHMPFATNEIRKRASLLNDKSEQEIKKLLETLKNRGQRITPATIGGSMWKFL